MTDTIQLELNRAFAMGAAWDEAAEALRRLDTQGFDRAMTKFNREAALPNKRAASNS